MYHLQATRWIRAEDTSHGSGTRDTIDEPGPHRRLPDSVANLHGYRNEIRPLLAQVPGDLSRETTRKVRS